MGFSDYFSGSGALSPERAATAGFHSDDSMWHSSGDSMTGLWNQSQDIVDPLGLMHTPKAQREAQAYQEMMGNKTLAMQQDWMDYIKREYAPYSEVARTALGAQMGLSGLRGTEMMEGLVSDIEADPFYQAKVRAGDAAIMRGASATGGLRSGDTQAALAGQNQMLLDAEIDKRYQRLAGLSGQGFTGQKAGTKFGQDALGGLTGTMGTLMSGSVAREAAAQDRQSGLMGLAGGVLSAFSDERLKDDIEVVGKRKGFPWYRWTWNKLAKDKFGLKGEAVGFMASDIEQVFPDMVWEVDGYKALVYGGVQ
jgi:hypothetical protein